MKQKGKKIIQKLKRKKLNVSDIAPKRDQLPLWQAESVLVGELEKNG